MSIEKIVTSEMCSKWHPDKYADQISDAVLTECLKQDKASHVACEVLVKDKTVVLAGEITSKANIVYEDIVKKVAKSLNYEIDNIINLISTQSPEINNAVIKDNKKENLGAGDQGIMWGYAVNDPNTDYLPYGLWKANKIIETLEKDIEENKKTILKGDAKTQVVAVGKNIKEILISACHKEELSLKEVQFYIKDLLIKNNIINVHYKENLIINPAGIWTIGGPVADCGLTGRKIVCDAYGGYAPVGGGAFSGKDPTKVDRSAAYMARIIAKDAVREFSLEDCTIQLSYGIGLSEPRSIKATGIKKGIFKTKKIDVSDWVKNNYDLTPNGIIEYLDLLNLDYFKIAGGNHMKNF